MNPKQPGLPGHDPRPILTWRQQAQGGQFLFGQGPLHCSAPQESPKSQETLTISLQKRDAQGNFTVSRYFAKVTGGLFSSQLIQTPPASLSTGDGLCPLCHRPCKGHSVQQQSPFPVILHLFLLQQGGGKVSTPGTSTQECLCASRFQS